MIRGELEPLYELRLMVPLAGPRRRVPLQCLAVQPPSLPPVEEGGPPLAFRDAAFRDLSLRSVFARAKRLEQQYAQRLRSLAKLIEIILRGHDVSTPEGAFAAAEQIRAYEPTARKWARAVAHRMVTEVAARDERSWFRVARDMGQEVRRIVQSTDVGGVFRARLEDQVELIASIPVQAAQRVHEITVEHLATGGRAETLAKDIMATSDVTKARASLIARTETSRTATEFTMVRAKAIGSTHFVWRTAGDPDVRPSHKKLNHTIHRWDEPPECDPGKFALPGCIYNCRCSAEPVVPPLS